MFVPDDARERRIKDKLTPAAWLVYESHCARRYNLRHKAERLRGLSFATKQEVAAAEGIALNTVKNAYTELRKKGWIEELSDGSVRLLVGDFSPVDRTAAKPAADHESHPESGTLFPELRTDRPESGTENPDLRTERPDLGTGAYIGTRARFHQPSPANTSTHTPAPAAQSQSAANAPPDDGGVCVSLPRHSKETLRRYAAAHADRQGRPLGEGWVTEAFRSGEWNDAVTLWLEGLKPEQQARAFVARPAEPAKCPQTCPLCFGAGTEVVSGKGARRCPNLVELAAHPPEQRAHAPP